MTEKVDGKRMGEEIVRTRQGNKDEDLQDRGKERNKAWTRRGERGYFLTNYIKPSRVLSPLCLHFPPWGGGGGEG